MNGGIKWEVFFDEERGLSDHYDLNVTHTDPRPVSRHGVGRHGARQSQTAPVTKGQARRAR